MSQSSVVKVTDASFQQDVLNASGPVLVDFWAEWCGPCKVIAPLLDEAASEYQGKLTIAKLNADENPLTPQRLGVRSLPTLLLIKNGKVEGQKVGALRKSDLTAFIESKIA
jgi:thioredoxin 1